MRIATAVACAVAAAPAMLLAAFETAWWLLFGRRVRAFAADLDAYFADQMRALPALRG